MDRVDTVDIVDSKKTRFHQVHSWDDELGCVMAEQNIDVESMILDGLSKQVSTDLDWTLLTIYWEWNWSVPRWVRWVCRNRFFFWFAQKMKWGIWIIPPFPD